MAKKIKALAHRRGLSFKQALNEVLRRGLNAPSRPDARTRYTVEPHEGGFRPEIDSGKLNQLVDQLEAEDLVANAQR